MNFLSCLMTTLMRFRAIVSAMSNHRNTPELFNFWELLKLNSFATVDILGCVSCYVFHGRMGKLSWASLLGEKESANDAQDSGNSTDDQTRTRWWWAAPESSFSNYSKSSKEFECLYRDFGRRKKMHTIQDGFRATSLGFLTHEMFSSNAATIRPERYGKNETHSRMLLFPSSYIRVSFISTFFILFLLLFCWACWCCFCFSKKIIQELCFICPEAMTHS